MEKAWIISVDMGYGHQRAAYPLKDISFERIITANSDKIITDDEKKMWNRFEFLYESVSRMMSIPIIGKPIWNLYDRFQAISPFYPFRDLSRPNFGANYTFKLIRKGLFKSLITYVKERKIPIISTFFAPALAAAHMKVKENYCVVTDTDINRVWVPKNPKIDKLIYLTPTTRSTRRIQAYGVPKKNIIYTGFPLPKENTGKDMKILKRDLGDRLANLDPDKKYLKKYLPIISKELGKHYHKKSSHPLTLTYVVGGAGAQKEIGYQILKSLRSNIINHKIRVNLITGTRPELHDYFIDAVKELRLTKELENFVRIQLSFNKKSHFEDFNRILHTTDILWTKPSELSFYTALGLPIIIAPPLGHHEELNQKWLMQKGAGFPQENPLNVNEWLFDWLKNGILAEAAWEGYVETPKYGTYNIEKIVFKKKRRLKY